MTTDFLTALKAKLPDKATTETRPIQKENTARVITGYTHNQDANLDNNLNGTYLLDRVETSYNNLVDLFGEPILENEGKVEALWLVRLSSGEFFSIYNWKNSTSYLGAEGLPIAEVRSWHIGGTEHSRSGSEPLKACIHRNASWKVILPVRPVEPIVEPETDAPKDAFNQYRIQCAFLLKHLGIDAADLQLLAIDCLYQKTRKGRRSPWRTAYDPLLSSGE